MPVKERMIRMSIRVNDIGTQDWVIPDIVYFFRYFSLYIITWSKWEKREMHKAREMDLKETLKSCKDGQREQNKNMKRMRNHAHVVCAGTVRLLSSIIAPLKKMSKENDLSARILSEGTCGMQKPLLGCWMHVISY